MKNFIERALRVIEEEIIPETKKGVAKGNKVFGGAILTKSCLLYTSPSPRDRTRSRMPSSA